MTEQTFDSETLMSCVQGLTHAGQRIRLTRLDALARLDRSREYQHDGFTSVPSFLVARCGMGVAEANREVFLARSIGDMPYATKLASVEKLSVSQLELLAHARAAQPNQYDIDEPTLSESVSGLDLADTKRAVDYWKQAHSEPGAEAADPSRCYLSRTFGDRGRLDGDLTPEHRAILEEGLDSLISEIVRGTNKTDLPSRPELRAEALVEMARRHLDSPTTPTNHGNRPHLTVLVDWNVLTGQTRKGTCELADGTIISPQTAQRLACGANVCRLLTGPGSEILDLGRTRRTVSPAQWKALRARDRHCQFPGCKRPWSWTDAHHVPAWTEDGETNLDKLILVCRHHHTLFHEGGWSIERGIDGWTFRRPDHSILANAPPG